MKMERSAYEKDLKKRQKHHLKNVRNFQRQNEYWQPCMHDSCLECIGTGIKLDGSVCVHMIHCSCPKCNPIATVYPGTIICSGTDLNFSITSDPNYTITNGIGYFTNTSTDTWSVKTIDA